MMKQISYWAKENVLKSRLLIVIFWLLLNIFGLYVGELFREIDIKIPENYFSVCLFIITILWIKYPQKASTKEKRKCSFYTYRKTFDVLLGFTTLILIVYTGNHWSNLNANTQTASASTILNLPKDSFNSKNILIKNFVDEIKSKDVSKLSNRNKSKIIKKQIGVIKGAKDLSKGEKTMLIILSIVFASFLLFGIAALSCSLSCSGMEGLATLVFIGGTALIVFLLIYVFKKLKTKKPPGEEIINPPK